MVINHEVINKTTKHKIMKMGSTFLEGSSNIKDNNIINSSVLSIIEIFIEATTTKALTQTKTMNQT